MSSPQFVPIPLRIIALMQERNRIFAYSLARLAGEIKTTRFQCTRCGTCCTRAINGQIFLLDHDVTEVRKIDPAAFEPAPDPEFCDQNGTLYVSGYALRMKNDKSGSCWFLENKKCRIYDRRFSACRIYPHMLRRNAGEAGLVTWQLFAKMNEHGRYDHDVPKRNALHSPAKSRNMKMHSLLTRYHSSKPSMSILSGMCSGMIRNYITSRCGSFYRVSQSRSWCIMPENWKNTRL